jgi:hypothetical protein
MPIGTSTSPVFTTLPVSAKTFVPGEVFVPMPRNQSAPFSMIGGTQAYVSMLFRLLG